MTSADPRSLRAVAAARRAQLACLLCAVASFTACGEEPIAEEDPALARATPRYEPDIQAILRDHCTSCHASYGPLLGGVELDSYESASSNRVRAVCTTIPAEFVQAYARVLAPAPRFGEARPPCDGFALDSMPPAAQPRLTRAEQIALLRWLETGAPR